MLLSLEHVRQKDTSINASLKVDTAFIITTQPVNQITCAGSSVNFSIAAIGTGLTYQWRKGNVNLINGVKNFRSKFRYS